MITESHSCTTDRNTTIPTWIKSKLNNNTIDNRHSSDARRRANLANRIVWWWITWYKIPFFLTRSHTIDLVVLSQTTKINIHHRHSVDLLHLKLAGQDIVTIEQQTSRNSSRKNWQVNRARIWSRNVERGASKQFFSPSKNRLFISSNHNLKTSERRFHRTDAHTHGIGVGTH